MPIRQIVQLCDEKHGMELKYSLEKPWDYDICVHLSAVGLILRFDPCVQKLHLIEVCDPPKVTLEYEESTFCSNGDKPIVPTFVSLYKIFGPTYPGNFSHGDYRLHYPGLALYFPVPEQYQSLFDESNTDLPEEFPDGTTPIMSRLAVHSATPPTSSTTLYADSRFGIMLESKACIQFGASPQQVISILGPPDSILHKDSHKLSIHSNTPASLPGWFMNYRKFGMDMFISENSVAKFVLHGNPPGHVDFGDYDRCQYAIIHPDAPKLSTTSKNDMTIEGKALWPDLKQIFNDDSRPVVSTRGLGDPFGATHFHGSGGNGYVFEVMSPSNAIATVSVSRPHADDVAVIQLIDSPQTASSHSQDRDESPVSSDEIEHAGKKKGKKRGKRRH